MSSSEAQRQQALLQALWRSSAAAGFAEQGDRLQRGLAAYRGNAGAIAERSLAASHPTVQDLLGDEDFAALARELWRHQPPERGDLAEWGAALPTHIESHAQLQTWPYLADCARLDWAVHRCERAADAEADHASLALLGTDDPAALTLQLMPGLSVLNSPWPLADIHAAHHAGGAARAQALAAARTAIAEGAGQSVVVWRSGWRAQVLPVRPAEAAWMQTLQSGATLAAALHSHQTGTSPDTFDFSTWLPAALSHGWFWRVARTHAIAPSPDHPA